MSASPIAAEPRVHAVEASAGTGKTHRIGELVVEQVLRGVRVERIVLSSYTNAAADELAARVRAALAGALVEAGAAGSARRPPTPEESALLRRAIADLDRACIGTIHSFCARLLEDAAEVAGGLSLDGLSPDESSGELVASVVADVWAAMVAPSPVAISLLGDSAPTARACLAALAQSVDAEPDAAVEPPPDLGARDRIQRDLDALLADAAARGALHGLAALAGSFVKKDGHAEAVAALASIDGSNAASGLAVLAALPSLRPADGDQWSVGAQQRKGARAALDAWSSGGGSAALTRLRSIEAACREAQAPFRSGLAGLLRTALRERRAAHRTYSYGDLVDRAWQLVREEGSSLVQHARARFEVAILDECQDTDPVQQAVFRRIFDAPGCTLHVVGDPKQSIYAFRGADLDSYLRLGDRARQDAPLTVSRRSDAPHVAAVEGLFTGIGMPFGHDRIRFTPVSAWHVAPRCSRTDGLAASGIELLWLEGESQVEGQRKASIDAAATRIRQWIEPGGPQGLRIPADPEHRDALRAAGPGDVAVLCQSRSDLDAMRAALERLGVPSVIAGDSSVLLSGAAEDMLAILHACASRRAVQAAIGAALTRALGATAEEVQQRRDEWVAALRECARAAQREGIDAALAGLLERPLPQARVGERQSMSALEILLSQPGGERHAVDLIHVRELLSGAERAGAEGPEALLHWLRTERAAALASRGRGGDAARRLRTQASRDAVVLQTLHSSKGLTYPIVVLPTIAIGMEPEEAPTPLHTAVEGSDGYAVRVIDVGSPRWSARAAAHVGARALERRRLLYVAVTRARYLTCICMHDVPARDRVTALDELLGAAPQSAGMPAPSRRDSVREWGVRAAEALRRLAPEHAGSVEPLRLEPLPEPWSGPPPSPAERAPLCPADMPVDRWAEPSREHSFTSLSRSAAAGQRERQSPDFANAREPDEPGASSDVPDASEAAEGACPADAAIRQLGVSGADLGVVLHAALDRAFHSLGAGTHGSGSGAATAPPIDDPLSTGIEQELARLRPLAAGTQAAARATSRAIRAALAQRLPMGCPSIHWLASRQDAVLREFQVSVPLAGRREDIARAFAAHGGDIGDAVARRISAAPAQRLDGILHGIIDVAARAPDGAWHIVDWKSNDLGRAARAYSGASLESAVVDSLYPLQAAIYVTILGRWLGRVEPGAAVAAAHYLFLRGMDAAAPGRGIWTWSPPVPLRHALDRLVDAGMDRAAGGDHA